MLPFSCTPAVTRAGTLPPAVPFRSSLCRVEYRADGSHTQTGRTAGRHRHRPGKLAGHQPVTSAAVARSAAGPASGCCPTVVAAAATASREQRGWWWRAGGNPRDWRREENRVSRLCAGLAALPHFAARWPVGQERGRVSLRGPWLEKGRATGDAARKVRHAGAGADLLSQGKHLVRSTGRPETCMSTSALHKQPTLACTWHASVKS